MVSCRALAMILVLGACTDAAASPSSGAARSTRATVRPLLGVGDVVVRTENRLRQVPCDSTSVALEGGPIRSRDTVVMVSLHAYWDTVDAARCIEATIALLDSLAPTHVAVTTSEADGALRGVIAAIIPIGRYAHVRP